MSLYRYRAKDRKGHKYKGIREGENEAQLVKSLAEDGLYCYFLQNEDRVVSMRHFTVPLKWLPPFCSQVSSMLSSGVPTTNARTIIWHQFCFLLFFKLLKVLLDTELGVS